MDIDTYDDDPRPRGGRNKHRDLKRFCRGNPKRPHEFEPKVMYVSPWSETMVDACTRCGKQRGHMFRVLTGPAPEWYRKLFSK